jgi:nucleoside-diphosphate-sugar epimerase
MAVPALRGVRQAMQFVHEDDACAGLLAAGRQRAVGIFNLATTDWLSEKDIAAIAGGRVIPMPRRAAIAVSEIGYRLRLFPFGADRSSLMDGPLALDPGHAIGHLGWKPKLTSADVLAQALR